MTICSVVLPVYNCDKYVGLAIDSILAQTYKDFELIIIDDGSTDNSLHIIKSYKDPRIKIISRENKGLVASLNEGIRLAHGRYIARHDADDISEPTRIEKQLYEFGRRPKLVLLGTSIITIDMKGSTLNRHRVLSGVKCVKSELLIRSPFAHGSVMFRKDAFSKTIGYDTSEWPAEDYGLWVRLAGMGDMDNLSEPLYRYRENDVGISATNSTSQQDKTKEAQELAWSHFDTLIRPFTHFEKQQSAELDARFARNFLQYLRTAQSKRSLKATVYLLSSLAISPALSRKIVGIIRRSI